MWQCEYGRLPYSNIKDEGKTIDYSRLIARADSISDITRGRFMNFSEEATGSVLRKKLFLKILQYLEKSCRPSLLTLFLSSDKLLTGYEQLSY